MSGLLALLDDVAAIAKVAASSLDDVASQAVKAGSKAAGAAIDDAAVTPKYLHGFDASRELPIVWRITKGSLKNKLLFLLPAGLLLSSFAPWAIVPLLMLGGGYLCFEGAEKVLHMFFSPAHLASESLHKEIDPVHLEDKKAAGAIKTDFILSAEIMTIALAAIPESSIWLEAATLAVVGVGITAVVYGSVALIVKADDVGLHMVEQGRFAVVQFIGRGIVRGMPGFLIALTTVGTAAMLWVGGSIVVHGLDSLGFGWLGSQIYGISVAAGQALSIGQTALEWIATAALDGAFGLALGLVFVLAMENLIVPAWTKFTGSKNK